MTEDQFKPFVRAFFKSYCIPITDIPTSDRKTPDFEILAPNTVSLIELKIRGYDPKEQKADSEILKNGQVLTKVDALAKGDGLSAIIKKGCRQLSEHDPSHEKLHFLWIHCTGVDADLQFEEFRATLLGTQKVFSLSAEDAEMLECYYFHACEFYWFRDVLDGAFVSRGTDVTFYVNSLSPQATRLRTSELYLTLKEAILDPEIQGKEKGGLLADADCPRGRDEVPTLVYLRAKFGLPDLQSMTFQRYTAAIAVPDKKPSKT